MNMVCVGSATYAEEALGRFQFCFFTWEKIGVVIFRALAILCHGIGKRNYGESFSGSQ